MYVSMYVCVKVQCVYVYIKLLSSVFVYFNYLMVNTLLSVSPVFIVFCILM